MKCKFSPLKSRNLKQLLSLATPFLVAASLFVSGSPARSDATSLEYSRPVGIALGEITYPYPVKFLPLEIKGEPLRMAYMDVQFQFIQAPPRSGAIVLLHGKNFYGSYWENTINALASQGYRVVVPDQIGFGKSSKPDDIRPLAKVCLTSRNEIPRS